MQAQTGSITTESFEQAFIADPRSVIDHPPEFATAIDPAELDAARLTVARRRFASAVESIALVRKLADRNRITTIEDVADLVPLLYRHGTFKSYPQSWLENSDFGRLTRWLGKLCSADLGAVDASGCELIEEWMSVLLERSSIDLQISAGADGKAAFLPRSRDEWAFLQRLNLWNMQAPPGGGDSVSTLRPGVDRVPLIYLGARRGARTLSRFLDFYEESFGTGLVDTLHENTDSDLLSLAGRIRDASRKGEAGLLQIKPELLARKDEIARINAERPQRLEALIQRLATVYRDQRIICFGTMQMMHDLATKFREREIRGAYAPDSLFVCGGGFAGGVEPPAWKSDAAEAFGIPESSIRVGYSMQEALWAMHMCRQQKFHVPQTIVCYVLDEADDRPLPRTGRQSGRFAFFDLATDSSWGGYATNDHVTITWDGQCGCGRKGPFLDSPITRVSDVQDDKVSCAGTAGALEEATDFLLKS